MPTAGRSLSAKHREWIAGYLFVLPDALGLLLFVGAPMVLALSLGFFDVNGFGGYRFVGLANYRRMLRDPLFLAEPAGHGHLCRSARAGALCRGPRPRAARAARARRINGLFRCMFFMPQMVSLVVVALVWQVLLVDKIGIINRVAVGASALGGVSWLGDPHLALFAIVVVSVWFLMGFYMLIFLGGLQDIPKEYYEAAKIDGAGPVASFWHITLPLLQPTSFFVLLVSTVTAVCGSQTFDLVYVMTKGGPANSTSLADLLHLPAGVPVQRIRLRRGDGLVPRRHPAGADRSSCSC